MSLFRHIWNRQLHRAVLAQLPILQWWAIGHGLLPSQHNIYAAQSAAELRHMSDLRHNLELV